jgi:hypothetical protein
MARLAGIANKSIYFVRLLAKIVLCISCLVTTWTVELDWRQAAAHGWSSCHMTGVCTVVFVPWLLFVWEQMQVLVANELHTSILLADIFHLITTNFLLENTPLNGSADHGLRGWPVNTYEPWALGATETTTVLRIIQCQPCYPTFVHPNTTDFIAPVIWHLPEACAREFAQVFFFFAAI